MACFRKQFGRLLDPNPLPPSPLFLLALLPSFLPPPPRTSYLGPSLGNNITSRSPHITSVSYGMTAFFRSFYQPLWYKRIHPHPPAKHPPSARGQERANLAACEGKKGNNPDSPFSFTGNSPALVCSGASSRPVVLGRIGC